MKKYVENEILSKINYEFRDSLNVIMGMINIIDKTDDVDKINDSIKKIKETSQDLLHTINSILDISSVEPGKIELKLEEFSTEEMFRDIFDIIEVATYDKDIKIEIDILDNKDMHFIGDMKKINQVYMNLLENAIKFTERGGKIFLSVKCKENELGIVELISTIKDTGVGIPEDKWSNLYQGVGLTIAKNIIEAMQGELSITSDGNSGTTVTFNIFLKSCNQSDTMKLNEHKIEKNAVEHVKNTENEKFDFSNKTILLIEDVDINREIVQFLLEDTKVNCIEALDGKLGVELYNKDPEKYDLILMDIQMPNMDGFEATKRIRESGNPNSKNIPIIAMTASVFSNQVQDILRAGMNAHIGKPIDEMTLKRELAKYL